jgi:molybdopterin molybdotransferase
LTDSLFKDILPLEQALALVNQTFSQPKDSCTELVNLTQAVGRVLADRVVSPSNLPGFRRSTVDGFALRAEDTYGATEAKPAWLRVIGEVKMGQIPGFALSPGETALISTGGAMPQGADAVVMVEYTFQELKDEVEVQRPVAVGENVIEADADTREGEEVFAPGLVLRPEHIGLLCGLGIEAIEVRLRLRAVVFSTGDEVVAPGNSVNPGQVRDINGPMLVAALSRDGCQASYGGILPDSLDEVTGALVEALAASDIILISGGSSVGQRDHTAAAINSLGPPGVLVHGIGIKPGKPTIIGMSSGGCPIIGMPGNPTSAQVVYTVIIRQLLHRLQTGRPAPPPATLKAEFTRSLQGSSGRWEYVRVRLEQRDGRTLAIPLLGESGLISTLAYADGLVALSPTVKGIEAGTMVEVMPLG